MITQNVQVKDLFEKAVSWCDPNGRLRQFQAAGIYPFFKEFTGYEDCESPAEIRMGDRKILMFGSNNYLGLTAHPKVKEAAIAAIQEYGTGCSGSRMLNGTLRLHNQLEEELADFMNQEATLLFSTGFMVNQGSLAALAERGDVILADKQVHASLVDGMQTSFARTVRFRHNDMGHLESILRRAQTRRGPARRRRWRLQHGRRHGRPAEPGAGGEDVRRGSTWTRLTASACWASTAGGPPNILASKARSTCSRGRFPSPSRVPAASSRPGAT